MLIRILILAVFCLAFAALLLRQENRGEYVQAAVLKALASLCFVVVGFLCSPGSHPARLITLGLVLGGVADVLLNLRAVFREKGQSIFLAGILVFLSGHIVYLAAIFPLCDRRAACCAAGAALTALLMVWIFRQITAKKIFKIFGVIYVGAIVLLNCVAVWNLRTDPSGFTGLFTAGALLFLVSDIILILNTFGPENRLSLRVTNLILYYIGQLLIALSLLFSAAL